MVAIVIPEMGLLLLPINPTMRLLTVTKKAPKITTSMPIRSLFQIDSPGICGNNAISITSARLPNITNLKEISFSVLGTSAPPSFFSFKEPMLSLKEDMMVGMVLIRVMIPPAATAPAPICFT
jgi:hypothetical protein